MQKSDVEALRAQGGFWDHLEVLTANKTKNPRLWSKMGKFKAIVADMQDTIRNTFAGMANALSGSDGKIDAVKLRGVGRLFHLDGEVEIAQKELCDLGNIKNAADLCGKGR